MLARRNILQIARLLERPGCELFPQSEGNALMVFRRGEQIVETAREARQAERGPTVRNILVASTGLVVVAFAVIWILFFRT